MKTWGKKTFVSLALMLSAVAAGPVYAQAPVVGHPDPESLFTDPDPQLHRNKQVVLHIVRDLLEANHWSEAHKYLTEEYIQHNPNVPSGLKPVMDFFGSRPQQPIPARNAWKTKVVSVLAQGDLVSVAFVREFPHPAKPGQTYTTTWFDMWRIENGKAAEHWDPATIAPPRAN